VTSQPYRLPQGGRIDRASPLSVSFNGRRLSGFAGDTMASILLAHGQVLVGRSFKYHRPRGLLSHGSDEPNALLSVDRGPGRIDPNNRATMIEALDGLAAHSQNHWPSLDFDLGVVNDALSSLFAAGFYYKTFMWPRAFWDRLYEPAIRAAAGLGVAPAAADPDRYGHRHAHCAVLIVGAGPAGLSAALAAATADKSVFLVDEGVEMGGALLHDVSATIDGGPAAAWLAETLTHLRARDNVVLLPRTTAFGSYNHNHVGLVERVADHLAQAPEGLARERVWQVRAGEVVLATGAHERPLVFADNDRPGIMLADSVRSFINRYAVAPGRRIVFATNGASAYAAAADAKAAGLDVTLVDIRDEATCVKEVAELRLAGCEVLTRHSVVGSKGRKRVSGLIVARFGDAKIGARRILDCDCVGLSGGWTPAVHLFSQSRGKLRFEPSIDAFVPDRAARAVRAAGAARGTYDLAACLAEGFAAGAAAAGRVSDRGFSASATLTGFEPAGPLPTDDDPKRLKAFVDFQNDVTAKDIKLALREGFESVEHVKRYTTTGMATDQGKTSNMNALGLIARTMEKPIPEVGTTTFRPPYAPVTFGALVGPARDVLFDPVRKTPIHDWAAEHGATFENVALWRRAWYFPKAGEDERAAVARECKAARDAVGLFDATTLGKIEVVGRDAAEFMNRIYTNAWLKLETGRCRYGLMLKEDGYILDDGVVARLAADRFHVTTTTGGAARVLNHMEDYLQTEWPQLEVFLTSITEQWAVIAVQGPKARDVIRPLIEGVDLDKEAFPHMAVRLCRFLDAPCRLFRVSFTGELGYEINVPADFGRSAWEAVYAQGQAFGITPYGTQAMHVLRAERGFIIVGQETDGTMTPDDVGLAGMIAKAKPDFVGKRSLARPDLVAPGRKQLVGLLTDDPRLTLDEGAQVVADPATPIPAPMLGHVTSSYWSANCDRSIALAVVADGRNLVGRKLHATTPAGFAPVTVSAPVFFDPKGERVHG
jgi:sarcosine oxidase subunit alpha